MCEKICERCGEPVKKFSKEYEVFEKMHWICFHFTYEHGEYDIDEACDDPSCPCRINKDWRNEKNSMSDNSINIVSVDRKNIISLREIEEDPMGFGTKFEIILKDIDFGWQRAEVWIEKSAIEEFAKNLTKIDTERIGEASFEAMSPRIFELCISNYDCCGHISVRYLFGKSRTSLGRNERLCSTIEGEFELNPSMLEMLVIEFGELQ